MLVQLKLWGPARLWTAEGCRLAARKICVVGGQQVLECSQALCGAKGSGTQLAVVWWGDKAADACVDSGI